MTTDFCTVANQNCTQPAGWGGAWGHTENIDKRVGIPECRKCGEAVCENCAVVWANRYYCPDCYKRFRLAVQREAEWLAAEGAFDGLE